MKHFLIGIVLLILFMLIVYGICTFVEYNWCIKMWSGLTRFFLLTHFLLALIVLIVVMMSYKNPKVPLGEPYP